MKDIPHIRGKFYIAKFIAEGEHETQDFKYAISDARKIARSISAFANNSGGRLLIGVKDNGAVAGVRNEEDIYMVEAAAQLYCRPAQDLHITAFTTEGGAVVIRAEISKSPIRPVQSQEPDGSWRAYYRVKDENIMAHPLMVRSWRKESSAEGLTMALSEAEQGVLRYLRSVSSASVEQIMIEASLSKRTAEEIIVRLATIGVIRFVYARSCFELTTADSE
ncbi:MAG: ATP-binding protein [Paramuribaculum sp.]|nr:ATP-binding protein [Paramuribaculum sp.]